MLFETILVKIKRVVWNRGILIFVSEIYSRFGSNGFHRLFDADSDAMIDTSAQAKDRYMEKLRKRRQRILNRMIAR